MHLFLTLLPPIVVFTMLGVFIATRITRRQDGPGGPLIAGDGNVTPVPVRSIVSRGGGLMNVMTTNSMNPSLAIGPGGVSFRVLKDGEWPWSEIRRVHVGWSINGYQVIFSGQRGTLYCTLRDRDAVREALALIPAGAPLSAKAQQLLVANPLVQ